MLYLAHYLFLLLLPAVYPQMNAVDTVQLSCMFHCALGRGLDGIFLGSDIYHVGEECSKTNGLWRCVDVTVCTCNDLYVKHTSAFTPLRGKFERNFMAFLLFTACL